ncbi:MAG: DUF402 domain-containing protein [Caldilineales bacterium]|nr:DUF402 domain-containing protein [Caldilineales bacterium]
MLTIHKTTPAGSPAATYPAWLLDDGDPLLVLAQWTRPTLALPYVTFAQGDLLIETFYRDRPYNIFSLYHGAGIEDDLGERVERGRRPMAATDFDAVFSHWRRVLALDGRLKGHYINISAPAVFDPAARTLIWRDLALDIWAPAAGDPLLLDEDEYAALGLAASDPALHQQVQQAVAHLWQQATLRSGPFAP